MNTFTINGPWLFFAAIGLLLVTVAGFWLARKVMFLLPDPAHFDRELDSVPERLDRREMEAAQQDSEDVATKVNFHRDVDRPFELKRLPSSAKSLRKQARLS
jgi:hypothetical protein